MHEFVCIFMIYGICNQVDQRDMCAILINMNHIALIALRAGVS